MSASGESSTTMHRLLHASGSHPIPTPYDPKRVGKRVKVRRLSCRVSMTFRVMRTNQYNQDLGLIHSTNGNHLESPNEGSSIDHQVTIYLHAQNITMFPTNETCVDWKMRPDISYLLPESLRNPYCSPEPYFLSLPSIYAAVWSKIGGSELIFHRAFD
ncbi:hypothetical protein F511_42180 [Dorcoceras hygrometricum]|uniref:Uncharacterized protein n=1 Tax=Dorcoceras hygrometricum TaxID=472368 RepID=A0A2Z7BKW2_9LAMI|nr:hypothetical protein F511_42180 [Dorcoceras hygrometricum]